MTVNKGKDRNSFSESIKTILSDCGGITYETYSNKYTLRKGVDLKNSPSSEISWMPGQWCNDRPLRLRHRNSPQ